MLPTLTLHDPKYSTYMPVRRGVVTPCAASPVRWTTPRSRAAASGCLACPLQAECLALALRVDAAFVAGRDRVGLTGTFGGVWFDQDHHPTPPGHDPMRRARPHSHLRAAA